MTNPIFSRSASCSWSGSEDFTVTTAMSAYEAIRLLEKERFDTIISDYLMPGMDGIQFLVEVRTRLGPIPFILFTGKAREEVVIQAINSGVDFYLQKGGEPGAQFAEHTHTRLSRLSPGRGRMMRLRGARRSSALLLKAARIISCGMTGSVVIRT